MIIADAILKATLPKETIRNSCKLILTLFLEKRQGNSLERECLLVSAVAVKMM